MNTAVRILDEEEHLFWTAKKGRFPASPSERHPAVDLVVLIDPSDVMKPVADTLSKVVGAAIGAAALRWPASLRVTYLITEGALPGTVFMITARGYLTVARKVDESLLTSRPRRKSTGASGGQPAEVAGPAGHALVDVLAHFDWRPGATRNVLFLGDGPLDGARSLTPAGQEEDLGAARRVVELARQTRTRVHMGLGTGWTRCGAELREERRDEVEREYTRVAVETGGRFSIAQDSPGACLEMLEGVIVDSTTPPRIAATEPWPG
ncbi:hypothetical protein [Sorangium cellulosum]|nr:hypothetical protein [Sorangium cellulosum]